MPLYDCGAEDCEECQVAFRGVKPNGPITREEIIDLIHSHYDPMPKDWPARHRGWDDGAGDIADRILARLNDTKPSIGDEVERLRAALHQVLRATEDGDEMKAVSMAEAALSRS